MPVGVPEEQKRRTNQRTPVGVPVKDPLKVKSVIKEFSRTQKCKSEGEFTYLKRVIVCCLYSSGELT